VADLHPTDLEEWLEWAGAKLIALPGGRIGPGSVRVFWPDYTRDDLRFDLDPELRRAAALRQAAPSGPELDRMDALLALPNLIALAPRRRIVRLRTLVHPITGRHLWPWTRLAEEFSIRTYTAKLWYSRGLSEVCSKLTSDKVHTLRAHATAFDLSF
jgi:hypothetical protein